MHRAWRCESARSESFVCASGPRQDVRFVAHLHAMPPWPGPGELVFIFMMLVFVLVGEKLPRIADALGKALRGPK